MEERIRPSRRRSASWGTREGGILAKWRAVDIEMLPLAQEGLNRLLMWEERPGRKALDLQTTTKSDKFNLLSLIPRHDLGTSNGGESPKAVYEGFNLIAQRAGIKSGDIVDALRNISAVVNRARNRNGTLGLKSEGDKEFCPRDLSRTCLM